MGCNCKQRNAVIEKYGEPEEESVLEKASRSFLKLILFVVALILGVVITPIILFTAIYKIMFAKGEKRMLVLPKVLSKHLEYGKQS